MTVSTIMPTNNVGFFYTLNYKKKLCPYNLMKFIALSLAFFMAHNMLNVLKLLS